MTRSILGAAVGALLTGSILFTSNAIAGFSLMAGAPSTNDGKTTVSVVVLNEETRSQTYHIPEMLHANTVDGPVDLQLASPQPDQLLSAGQFLRVNYVASQKLSPNMIVSFQPLDIAPTQSMRTETAAATTITESAQPTSISDMITTKPTSKPESKDVESSLVETLGFRLKAHEPVYFLAGPEFPNAKFQFSLKYHLIGEEKGTEQAQDNQEQPPESSGVYLAYSQTSFWDLEGFSKPFFDSSYRPEIFYQFDEVEKSIQKWTGWELDKDLAITVQTGLKHESNGKGETPVYINRGDGRGDVLDAHPSRSLNIAYARAILNFKLKDDYILKVSPSVHAYVLGMDDENDDIADYRGYGDLKLVFGKQKGWQVAATGRVGREFDKGSLQLDFSMPISELHVKDFDIYFHAQFFTGYGEILHDFDQSDNTFRIGISMVR